MLKCEPSRERYERQCRLKQCFNCQKYGHIGTQCKTTTNGLSTLWQILARNATDSQTYVQAEDRIRSVGRKLESLE